MRLPLTSSNKALSLVFTCLLLSAPGEHAKHNVVRRRRAKTKIACIGDSITDGSCCGLDSSTEIYPVQLQSILGNRKYKVKEYGVMATTGSKSCNPSYWDTSEYTSVLDWEPDVVIIMFGSNDAKTGYWKSDANNGCSKDHYEADMKQMIENFASLSNNPRVFAAYPPRAFSNPYSISNEVVINEIIPAIDSAASMLPGVEVLDTYNETSAHSSDWYFGDGVHLNPIGAGGIAKYFASLIIDDSIVNERVKVSNRKGVIKTRKCHGWVVKRRVKRCGRQVPTGKYKGQLVRDVCVNACSFR